MTKIYGLNLMKNEILFSNDNFYIKNLSAYLILNLEKFYDNDLFRVNSKAFEKQLATWKIPEDLTVGDWLIKEPDMACMMLSLDDANKVVESLKFVSNMLLTKQFKKHYADMFDKLAELSDEGDTIRKLAKDNGITGENILSMFLEVELVEAIKLGQSKFKVLLRALEKEKAQEEKALSCDFTQGIISHWKKFTIDKLEVFARAKFFDKSNYKELMKELRVLEEVANSCFVSNALNNVGVHMSEDVRNIVRNKYPEYDLKGMNPYYKFPTV